MKQAIILALLSSALFGSTACKKEYIDKIRQIAGDTVAISGYTNITSFDVKEFSADTIISASITNDSIIVYWPSYKPIPDSIHPVIALPEQATILPASGTSIPFQDGFAYQVTAEAGLTKTYKLFVHFLQPVPNFSLGSNLVSGLYFDMNGENFLADTSRTKILFVAADSTTYFGEVTKATSNIIGFIIPVNLPDGDYDVRIKNGQYTVYNSYPGSGFKTNITSPGDASALFPVGSPFNLKAGDTFDVRGLHMQDVKGASLYVPDFSIDYPLEVVEIVSQDRVRLKVPASVPLGTYKDLVLFQTSDKKMDGPYLYNSITATITQ